MTYTAVTIEIPESNEEKTEMLVALLDSLNYEGITEDEGFVIAYIDTQEYDRDILDLTLVGVKDHLHATITNETVVEEQNWNAEWESNFNPVIIDNRCVIRAPFHDTFEGMEYIINIEPKMSFGTGHHETTSLMVSALLDMDIKNKTVLDMGCGTGVLGILACMRNAKEVIGIDIDKWAYENAQENIRRNGVEMTVIQGDVEAIPDMLFDIIVANINRNVLVEHAPDYANSLEFCGRLFLSGFLEEDIDIIEATYTDIGLTAVNHMSLGQWQMLEFVK